MPQPSNLTPPQFGPKFPNYPDVTQVLRIVSSAPLPGNVYNAFTQQMAVAGALRDREPALVLEPNGIKAIPGYYKARLLGSYLNLPLYGLSLACCGPVSSSSVKPVSPTSPISLSSSASAFPVALIQTTCCPNPVPSPLFATISGAGLPAAFNGKTVPLIFDPLTSAWDGQIGSITCRCTGLTDPSWGTLALFCFNPQTGGSGWTLIIGSQPASHPAGTVGQFGTCPACSQSIQYSQFGASQGSVLVVCNPFFFGAVSNSAPFDNAGCFWTTLAGGLPISFSITQ